MKIIYSNFMILFDSVQMETDGISDDYLQHVNEKGTSMK